MKEAGNSGLRPWTEKELLRLPSMRCWPWCGVAQAVSNFWKSEAVIDLAPTLLSSLISYHIFSQMLCWPYELFPEKSMFTPFSMHLLRNSSLAYEQCPLIYLLIQAFIRNTFWASTMCQVLFEMLEIYQGTKPSKPCCPIALNVRVALKVSSINISCFISVRFTQYSSI